MIRKIFLAFLMLAGTLTSSAQRVIDKLDRGLIAIKVSGGVYVNWRIQSDEYYDVTYNLYRNGTKIAENLKVSNYNDAAGTTSSTYTVAAVVRGKEQTQCAAVTPWAQDYFEIKPKHDASLTSTYVPNDACCVDVDGDGQVEILIKYDNSQEIGNGFPKDGNNGEYTLFECLKLDGTVLWWVNCGPNMGDFQNNEQNIVGYDWDMDGKGEVIMRLCEGAQVHMADGTVYTLGADGKNGTSWTNYRQPKTGGVEWFTHYGNEYLFYCEGATGKPYQCISFPCKRLETGETDLNNAWGDGYGHRSNKFFFGAPYLDGRKPSMFIGRGIYTRHKFVALDVDPETHALTERWRWYNNTNGPWKGQGYHNYAIADVDMDGRDEIIWGSMVIDDNGKGLSTTGLGHGDAQHHGDLDPYTWGLEGFFCNEDKPGNNFRDLTTAKIYYRQTAGDDDGRAICGNFSNDYPGCQASSARDWNNAISTVTRAHLPAGTNGMSQNFRIYWDGDLCEETFNYVNGKNTEGAINKFGKGVIKTLSGSMTNNDTKGTPCYQGDILGDWREEVIMRTAANNIRVYTTTDATKWRNYSLWYDHQYRNAMVWQMCGYNQPPHASYFLGEMEGITVAPPSLTMEGRVEVANGATVNSAKNGQTVIACETNDMEITVVDGITPDVFVDNAPSWVQGYAPQETSMANDPSKITYTYYTHTIKGGGFAGAMRLVKQGEGTLVLPKVTQNYMGKTEVWNGVLSFDGTMKSSPVWLNRHTKLISDGGSFDGGIEAEYNAVISPAGADKKGTVNVATLTLNMGAVLELDAYSADETIDQVNIKKLIVNHHKDWQLGPKYLTPVIKLNAHLATGETMLKAGKYLIGTLETVEGNLSDVKVDGLNGAKGVLIQEEGKLYLEVQGMRDASEVEWSGAESSDWDLANTQNFVNNGFSDIFVSGDNVIFNDNAKTTNVNIAETVSPSSFVVTGSKDYTISGEGSIAAGSFTKEGSGTVTMSNDNTYTDGNTIAEGTVIVSKLANEIDPKGNLGGRTTNSALFVISNDAVLKTVGDVTHGSNIKVTGNAGTARGVIENTARYIQQATIAGDTLVKRGTGEFVMESGTFSAKGLIVKEGTFNNAVSYTGRVRLEGSSRILGGGFIGSPIQVASGAKAYYTTVNRTNASNVITGNGKLTVYCATEKGSNYYATRTPLRFNLANFAGTLVAEAVYPADGVFSFDTSNGSDKWTLEIPSTGHVQNSGKTLRIGKLAGTGTLGGTCSFSSSANTGINTWQVGNDEDFTFSGNVVDNAKFTKMGAGKMTAAKSWTNTGAVTVSAGELHGNAKIALGEGALTVSSGAMLSGYSGTVMLPSLKNTPMKNSSVTVNGSLYCYTNNPNAPSQCYWCFGACPVTVGSTGTLVVGIKQCATKTASGCGAIFGDASENSSLTLKDGATIKAILNYTPSFADEAKADSFRIFFDFAKVSVGDVKFDLPDLPEHYYWDTTKAKEGYLFVRYAASTGIKGIMTTDLVTVEVVNEAGVRVSQMQCVLSEVKQRFAKMSLPQGVYIIRLRNEGDGRGVLKIRK